MFCTTRMRAGCALLGGLLLLAMTGCAATPGGNRPPTPGGGRAQKSAYEDIEKIEKRDDIIRINQFWAGDPCIYDSIGRAIGFKVPTYFISSETEKGTFVSGRIFIWLHVVQVAPNRELVRRTVHMWQMEQAESFLFASRKKAIIGYFYGFIMTWPRSLDLGGQTLEIEFAYERADGRLVVSSGKTFRVPLDPREAFTTPMIRPKGFGETQPLDSAPPPPRREPLPLSPPAQAPAGQPSPTAAPAPGDEQSDPAMRARIDELERRAREILAENRREHAAEATDATTRPANDTPAAGRP